MASIKENWPKSAPDKEERERISPHRKLVVGPGNQPWTEKDAKDTRSRREASPGAPFEQR